LYYSCSFFSTFLLASSVEDYWLKFSFSSFFYYLFGIFIEFLFIFLSVSWGTGEYYYWFGWFMKFIDFFFAFFYKLPSIFLEDRLGEFCKLSFFFVFLRLLLLLVLFISISSSTGVFYGSFCYYIFFKFILSRDSYNLFSVWTEN